MHIHGKISRVRDTCTTLWLRSAQTLCRLQTYTSLTNMNFFNEAKGPYLTATRRGPAVRSKETRSSCSLPPAEPTAPALQAFAKKLDTGNLDPPYVFCFQVRTAALPGTIPARPPPPPHPPTRRHCRSSQYAPRRWKLSMFIAVAKSANSRG